jgi:hypothetical protein
MHCGVWNVLAEPVLVPSARQPALPDETSSGSASCQALILPATETHSGDSFSLTLHGDSFSLTLHNVEMPGA